VAAGEEIIIVNPTWLNASAREGILTAPMVFASAASA
jgi:hypothetical protein